MGQTLRRDGKAFGFCDRCGEDFVRTARGKPYRFCSRECAVTPVKQRFEANVDMSGDCWLWTGKKNEDGYGELQCGLKIVKAHRLAYSMAAGQPIPEGLQVCHTCDTPACVRPSHLFLGDQAANMQDMTAKGRGVTPEVKGMEHGAAKLTDDQVLAIRADERSQRAIADAYGVVQSLVSQIKAKAIWKHLA